MANPKKMRIEVVERTGPCFYEYKAGDKWDVTGLKTPEGGFCGAKIPHAFSCALCTQFWSKVSIYEGCGFFRYSGLS